MYILDRHLPPDDEATYELIRQFPLGCIVRQVNGELVADHIPLLFAENGDVLRGHVAAANPLADEADDSPVLVIFNGAESYISPAWCDSKNDDGKIVPTWNYVVAHVNGTLTFHRDAAWLFEHLQQLTSVNEKSVGQSWQMQDAPADYLERLVQHIVGIEIRIDRIVGKWKTTLVQPAKNVESVLTGLESVGAVGMADEMADRYAKYRKTPE